MRNIYFIRLPQHLKDTVIPSASKSYTINKPLYVIPKPPELPQCHVFFQHLQKIAISTYKNLAEFKCEAHAFKNACKCNREIGGLRCRGPYYLESILG